MYKVINRPKNELSDETLLSNKSLKEMYFVSYAEYGAMGTGGAVEIVTKDGSAFSGVLEQTVSEKTFLKKFKYLEAVEFDHIMEHGVSNDGKYTWFYLGCGNHLLVHTSVVTAFNELAVRFSSPDALGGHWFEIACKLLPVRNQKAVEEKLGKSSCNSMTYEELVQKVDDEWNELHKDDKGPKCEWNPVKSNSFPIPVPWNWKENIHELNLWNYWQGCTTHKADIMLVGQDWGNPHNPNSHTLQKNVSGGRNYLDGLKDISPTDIHLIELFALLKKKGSQPLFEDIRNQRYENLYFTNFFLGYRDGKDAGGMTKSRMMKDAEYFRLLADIVDPKIIIALGRYTYECVVSALRKENFTCGRAKSFWDKLNTGENVESVTINEHKAVIIGVAHTGTLGWNVNRKRYAPEDNILSGGELMKQDWVAINQYIDELL